MFSFSQHVFFLSASFFFQPSKSSNPEVYCSCPYTVKCGKRSGAHSENTTGCQRSQNCSLCEQSSQSSCVCFKHLISLPKQSILELFLGPFHPKSQVAVTSPFCMFSPTTFRCQAQHQGCCCSGTLSDPDA